MDQSAHLRGQNPQLISGGIGNLHIQITLRHLYSGFLDFGNRSLDETYDHKREEDSHQDYDKDNRGHKADGGYVKRNAFLRRGVTALCIVGDDVIEDAV